MTPAERRAVVVLLDVAAAALKAIDAFIMTPASTRQMARQQLARVNDAIAGLQLEESEHGRRTNHSARV